jgi:hypothetical protein
MFQGKYFKNLLKYYVMSEEMGFAPIPAVTEPPKVLGPPTDVLVLYLHHIAQGRFTHHADITHNQRRE